MLSFLLNFRGALGRGGGCMEDWALGVSVVQNAKNQEWEQIFLRKKIGFYGLLKLTSSTFANNEWKIFKGYSFSLMSI